MKNDRYTISLISNKSPYTENTMSKTPDPHVRKQMLTEPFTTFPTSRITKMHTKTLHALVEYCEKWKEMMCGKQIWDLEETLSAAENEIKSRKES